MSADNLNNLLDSLGETCIFVVDEATGNLLFFNKNCEKLIRGKAKLGAKCSDVWSEDSTKALFAALKYNSSASSTYFDPELDTTFFVTANKLIWDGQGAVAFTATPRPASLIKENGYGKVEKMYKQSLVTIFDECIIADLTSDRYVNCRKDSAWNGIPVRGTFSAENPIYAAKMLHPDDAAIFSVEFSREALMKSFGEGKRQITKRLRRLGKDGSYRMADFTAAKLDAPDREVWCALVFCDVQDDYVAEQQRNLEISQLVTAAHSAYQMIIAVNLTLNTYHMLDYERYPVSKPVNSGCFDELIESELATVRPDCQKEFIEKFSRKALLNASILGERIVSMKVPHKGEDGIYHWFFTQVIRVVSEYTDDVIEITLSRNIDDELQAQAEALEKERKGKELLEEALLKAEKANNAKSEFLSKMSHDIRTPMNAVAGMTELALRHIEEPEKLKNCLEIIAMSGQHLLGLINDVLDVSKIESGEFKLREAPFDITESVNETLEIVHFSFVKKRQKFIYDIEKGLFPKVYGDERRLQQILINLLENASKYTGEEGIIKLSLKGGENEGQLGTYIFTVEDNGVGMGKDFLKHIYEPFCRADDSRTSKIVGTGLGMTIVKNLVSMMNGTIAIESEYGKGSRFTVTLCFEKCAFSPDAVYEPDVNDVNFSNTRILLVEDNELNREIAAEMFQILGVAVEVAVDGFNALNAVLSHPPHYYDAVFMDVQMPVMNGYQATENIRNSGKEGADTLPIIAMTANAFAEDEKRALVSGMNAHLAKPISVNQLKKALLKYCPRKNGDG